MAMTTYSSVQTAMKDFDKTEKLNEILKSHGLKNRYLSAAYYSPIRGDRILIKCRLFNWIELQKWSGRVVIINGWRVEVDKLDNPTEGFAKYNERELRWWSKWREAILEAAALMS